MKIIFPVISTLLIVAVVASCNSSQTSNHGIVAPNSHKYTTLSRNSSRIDAETAREVSKGFLGAKTILSETVEEKDILWVKKNLDFNSQDHDSDDDKVMIVNLHGQLFPTIHGSGSTKTYKTGVVAIRKSDGAILSAEWH